MKKLIVLIVCMSLSAIAFAQKMQEVIYLKNGSVIRGTVVEQVPGQSIKVETADGSVFVYQMQDVEKIAKEEKKQSTSGVEHPGMDFIVDLGPNFANGSTAFAANVGVGKRFSKSFYFGGLVGATFSSGDPAFGFALNPKVGTPIGNSDFSLNLDFRAGMTLVPDGKVKVNGRHTETETATFANFGIIPSATYALSSTMDVNLGVGYIYNVNLDGGSAGNFVIRAGFNFHKANYGSENSKGPKPAKPATRDTGFQLTYEGDWTPAKHVSLALVPTYKFNPHFSAGIGIGLYSNLVEDDYDEYDGNDYSENDKKTVYNYGWGGEDFNFKFFARGNYRMSDNKFSPFVNLDLGVMPMTLGRNTYELEQRRNGQYYYDWSGSDDISYTALFIKPSVGVSLRTSNNTSFNVMAGYHLSSAPEDGSLSAFNLAVNFTHTFKWGSPKLNELGKKLVIEKY